MAEQNTKKKKTVKTANKKKKASKRKLTPFTKLLSFVVVLVSFYLLYRAGLEVYTTITLKKQIAEVEERYQEVLDENEYLTREREKLEDPDYVASYARGTYLLSKDDEQIFYLPENEDR
ncbi:MAG: septum formation initiator family protein [Solobacterium sp.]|nr:septum formation initiator family protein [Solobacterium sp.]